VRIICLLALLSAAAPPTPRVRSSNPVIAAAIVDAQGRSATFKSLVEIIEKTDGIVYVERGRCGHGVPACLSHSVVSGDGFRLLRILVDSTSDLVALMATIGHELRHAIELLTEPTVRTTAAAFNYYSREFPNTGHAFETPAAIRSEADVARDLKNFRRAAPGAPATRPNP
jgi:hypothetical protein